MNAKAKTTLEKERFRIMIAWYCNEEFEPNLTNVRTQSY